MKKKFLILFPFLSLLFPQISLATVAVDVSNNGGNSSNSVNVNQQSSSQTTTDIKIETNGETKTFHAEGNQTVNWTSDDGKSSVKINNHGDTNTNVTQKNNSNVNTTTNTTVNSSINTSDTTENPAIKEVEKKREDVFGFLRRELEALDKFTSNFFRNLFHF